MGFGQARKVTKGGQGKLGRGWAYTLSSVMGPSREVSGCDEEDAGAREQGCGGTALSFPFERDPATRSSELPACSCRWCLQALPQPPSHGQAPPGPPPALVSELPSPGCLCPGASR